MVTVRLQRFLLRWDRFCEKRQHQEMLTLKYSQLKMSVEEELTHPQLREKSPGPSAARNLPKHIGSLHAQVISKNKHTNPLARSLREVISPHFAVASKVKISGIH